MNTKEFNKYLSTEDFLIKVFNESDSQVYPKYKQYPLQYYVDNQLIKQISKLKESSSIQSLAYGKEYELKFFRSFSTKDLNKFLIDLLKRHFSSKMLFDDSYYIANVILALGNTLNMKALQETITELIRQARVDLSRSMNLVKEVMGSYNNLILKACVQSLT